MVANTVLNGYAIELEVELEPNQEPQRKKERSLDSIELQDYDLENDVGELTDSSLPMVANRISVGTMGYID